MPNKTVLKIILIALNFVSLVFFLKSQYVYAGLALLAAGVIGIILGKLCAELVVLAGCFVISLVLNQKIVVLILAFVIIPVCIYDLAQFFQSKKNITCCNVNAKNNDWVKIFRERELLHKLLKKVIRIK